MLSFVTVALTAFSSSLFILSAKASPCVVFDANFNLYAFGLGGKDFSLGTQDTWTSGSATDITANGRPPFDGTNTTCYLAQFFNAIYVLNGDKSNPTNIGIYDAQAKSWSTQTTGTGSGGSGGSFDYGNFQAILDHDTNVFFALSGTDLWSLNFGTMKAATGSAINWSDVGKPSFSTSGYNPVMALAQNHVHFLDVPGAQPGTAQIFVIHFSFFQPDAQSYPASGGGSSFPVTYGQATSLFQSEAVQVQQEFAFIPDDGSNTYIINVENNSTTTLAGPSDKSSSTFTAGVTSLVQLTSSGNIFFFPYKQNDTSANTNAQWTQVKLSGLPAATSASSGSSPTASGSKTGSASTPTGSGSSSQSSGSGNGTGTAVRTTGINVVRTIGIVGLLAAIGCLF